MKADEALTRLKKTSLSENEKVIDWELAISLANGSRDFAEEMLAFLVKTLPGDYKDIKSAKDAKDYLLLAQNLHRLLGAVSYCGVPRLRVAIYAFEKSLKRKEYSEVSDLFTNFEAEVNRFMEVGKKL